MALDKRRPPAANRGPENRWAATSTRVARATDQVTHFQARVVVEALLDGWSVHNERQARRWESSRPRPEDFLGGSTVENQRERWRRMTAVASAYRNRASIAPLHELGADLVQVVYEEAIAC